jgi:hypothetical protein
MPPSALEEATQRACGYSHTPVAMGASAVSATDFYAGAATLVKGSSPAPACRTDRCSRPTRDSTRMVSMHWPHPPLRARSQIARPSRSQSQTR